MINRSKLVDYLDNLLICKEFKDYAPNGLQVEGAETIASIVTSVTASLDAITYAKEINAQALLVHHGYFWQREQPALVGLKYQRIKTLIKHDINLFAYHLPLDCHPTLGNNAQIANLLNVDSITMHSASNINNLLWAGKLKQPRTIEEFSALLAQKFMQKPVHVGPTNKLIKTVAWCSGGAQDYLTMANDLGVDAYLSGEISERNFYEANELGIHYFACGHHATERLGVQALGKFLANEFGLSHHFFDSNNPI